MGMYKCKNCEREFKQKCHLDNHHNKKIPCKKTINLAELNDIINSNDQQNILNIHNLDNINSSLYYQEFNNKIVGSESLKQSLNENKCGYCYKQFTRKDNIITHIKYNCKKKKEIEVEKKIIFDKLKLLETKNISLEKINKKIINEMNEIKKILIKKNKIKNITNITNIEQQNYNLINYNKEDLSIIDRKKFLMAIKKGYNTPVEVTRAIHFNDAHPEYHNIYIPRINEKHAMVFKDNQWKLMNKDELVDDLHDQKKAFVEDNFDEFYNFLDDRKKKSLLKWMNSDDNENCIKNTKESIKNLLYENKNIVLEYRRECQKKIKEKILSKNNNLDYAK
jgi:hypothetical protein